MAQTPDAHLVARRFRRDTNDWIDEGTGRLSSGAFRFDPWDHGEGRGCSVYDDNCLAAAGLPRVAVLENESQELVGATAAEIRALRRQNAPAENQVGLDVLEDAWPESRKGAHPRDCAHALIYFPPGATGLDRWKQLLAISMRPLALTREIGA